MNVIGEIMPCHKPAQNPAGVAPGIWYFEPGPATANMFAIEFLLRPMLQHKVEASRD